MFPALFQPEPRRRGGARAGMAPSVYFSIGDAIAGLGIFLLIPQYLKPIYVFRLRVLGRP